MPVDDARRADRGSAICEWVCDRCSPSWYWRWVIDSHMMPRFDVVSQRSLADRPIFNIKFQLIYTTNFSNLSILSLNTEMFGKQEPEENSLKEGSMGKKLVKGE